MDYNFNNIEELIKSGISADEIAQAFSDKLNKALKEKKYLDEAEEKLAEAWNMYVEEYNQQVEAIDVDDFYLDKGDVRNMMAVMVKFWNYWEKIASLIPDLEI